MLLSYKDPKFWKNFHAKHWVPRVPVVIKQPFKQFPFSEAALLTALKSFEAGIRGGDHRSTCLVSVGDKERAPRRPLRQLFRREAGSLEELEQNCAREFPKQRFGLMATNFQVVDSVIWDPITSFLRDARRHIDFPVPRAFLDLFYGNYLSSFTGLHKDTQEIFAFVVRGEKKILAWPFEYFLPKVKGLSPGAKYFHMRLPIDHRKYRKDAVVLDARAGDLIYWPSDRWHVAEAQKGKFSAMVSLGLFRPEGGPFPSRLTERLLADPELRSQDLGDAVSGADVSRQLRWLTGFGFEIGPAPRERFLGRVAVDLKPSSLLLWKVDRPRRRVIVAANAHSASFPLSTELLAQLEKLARGETLTPSSKPKKSTPIVETHWDEKCELKSRRRTFPLDSSSALVHWLREIQAVRVSTIV